MKRIVLLGAVASLALTQVSPVLLAQRGAQAPAAPARIPEQEPTPPLLFAEKFQQVPAGLGAPTSPRVSESKTKEYWLAGQSAITNPNVELKLYGIDAKNITVYMHESRIDLWTGMTSSPVAILLKDRRNFIDLNGRARVRAILRTNSLHQLHPVIRLADGTMVVGHQVIDTEGQYVWVDVSFIHQRWYTIERDTLAVKGQVTNVDLGRVDEVGFVDLAPAGGHGNSGWANVSWFEVYAKGVPRS